MPTGRVKDPEGHQSKPHGWGYIKRDNLEWDDERGRKKVIPFENPSDADGVREFKHNQKVSFEVDSLELGDNGLTIGVAIDVVVVDDEDPK